MMEIKGKVNTALCFATIIETEAIEQIRRMCDIDNLVALAAIFGVTIDELIVCEHPFQGRLTA